jgi:hypothetical protein
VKSYVIDEIPREDMAKIEDYLGATCMPSGIERLFWVEVPVECLSEIQAEHNACQPHVFAIETGTDWVRAEFFIRTLNDLRCPCSGYCTMRQREYILGYMENIIGKLGIRT